MKNVQLFCLPFLFLCFLALACSNQAAKTSDAGYIERIKAIPTLLDRNAALYMGKEWENSQNQYGKNREIVAKDSNNVSAYLNLVQVFIAEARVTGEHGHYYPAALTLVDKALAVTDIKEEQRFQALALKAGVLLSLHQFENALSIGKQAIELNPHNAHIHGVLVDAYVELGRYQEAIAEADKMVVIRPDLRSYARISYLREIHGDVEGAEEALKMAVQAGAPASEETAWAMLTLGHLYQEYGDSKIAREIYKEIIEERDNYPFAVAALAQLDFEKGKTAEAERGLEKAIASIPEVSFYVSLAKIYQKTGRNAEAEKVSPEILAMLEDDTKAGHVMNLEYAEVYGNLLGDWAKAKEYAQKEYDVRPENIDVNLKMALICKKLNQNKEADAHLIKAKRTKSKKPELMQLLASR